MIYKVATFRVLVATFEFKKEQVLMILRAQSIQA